MKNTFRKNRLGPGWWVGVALAAGWAVAGPPVDRFSEAWDRLAAAETLSDAQKQDLQALAEAYETAGLDAARAETRLASHTGAILSRELKKVPTSARLIEITKKTGRGAEIERYEERHRNLLEAIEVAATEYEEMIRRLCVRPEQQVEQGFKDYEDRLVEQGLADQIRIHQRVKKHYDRCRETGEAEVEKWKTELQEI